MLHSAARGKGFKLECQIDCGVWFCIISEVVALCQLFSSVTLTSFCHFKPTLKICGEINPYGVWLFLVISRSNIQRGIAKRCKVLSLWQTTEKRAEFPCVRIR